jgi:hypothetical protein
MEHEGPRFDDTLTRRGGTLRAAMCKPFAPTLRFVSQKGCCHGGWGYSEKI